MKFFFKLLPFFSLLILLIGCGEEFDTYDFNKMRDLEAQLTEVGCLFSEEQRTYDYDTYTYEPHMHYELNCSAAEVTDDLELQIGNLEKAKSLLQSYVAAYDEIVADYRSGNPEETEKYQFRKDLAAGVISKIEAAIQSAKAKKLEQDAFIEEFEREEAALMERTQKEVLSAIKVIERFKNQLASIVAVEIDLKTKYGVQFKVDDDNNVTVEFVDSEGSDSQEFSLMRVQALEAFDKRIDAALAAAGGSQQLLKAFATLSTGQVLLGGVPSYGDLAKEGYLEWYTEASQQDPTIGPIEAEKTRFVFASFRNYQKLTLPILFFGTKQEVAIETAAKLTMTVLFEKATSSSEELEKQGVQVKTIGGASSLLVHDPVFTEEIYSVDISKIAEKIDFDLANYEKALSEHLEDLSSILSDKYAPLFDIENEYPELKVSKNVLVELSKAKNIETKTDLLRFLSEKLMANLFKKRAAKLEAALARHHFNWKTQEDGTLTGGLDKELVEKDVVDLVPYLMIYISDLERQVEILSLEDIKPFYETTVAEMKIKITVFKEVGIWIIETFGEEGLENPFLDNQAEG